MGAGLIDLLVFLTLILQPEKWVFLKVDAYHTEFPVYLCPGSFPTKSDIIYP